MTLRRRRLRCCHAHVRLSSDTVADGIRDDQDSPRDSAMRLFDALGSAEKTLHANPGSHHRVPSFEIDSSVRFFARHLGSTRDL